MGDFAYRIEVDGEHREFAQLHDVEEAAVALDAAGTEVRIEYRRTDGEEPAEWEPLNFRDTVYGRLGHEPFPGYGKAGESG